MMATNHYSAFRLGFHRASRVGLILAGFAFFFGFGLGIQFAHADPWPKVAFAEWPSIPVAKMKDPEPPFFRSDIPGAVQPKPIPPRSAPRLCNERQPLGYWLLVPCLFPRNADPEQSALLNPPS